MHDPAITGWLAGFLPGDGLDLGAAVCAAAPRAAGLEGLAGEALARLLPPGEDVARHVEAVLRVGDGVLTLALRGLTAEGRRAVDALAEGG